MGAKSHAAEKAHWQGLGMYIAELDTSSPGGVYASPGARIAKFLRLEGSPAPSSYVVQSLRRIRLGTPLATLNARLSEFSNIYDELADLEPSPYALTKLRWTAWRACLSEADDKRLDDDVSDLNRAAANERQRVAAQERAPDAFEQSRTESDSFRFAALPEDRFSDYKPFFLTPLMLAVDRALAVPSEQGRAATTDGIGRWISTILEKEVLRPDATPLQSTSQCDDLVALLGWIAQNPGGDASQHDEFHRIVDRVKALKDDAVLLVSPTQISGKPSAKTESLPEMELAWKAAWEGDSIQAARQYELAAGAYRKRSDRLGLWRALDGLIVALQSHMDLEEIGAPDYAAREEEREKRIREAQAERQRVEGVPVVRQYLDRRGWILSSAQDEALTVARDEGVMDPGRRRIRMTAAPTALASLLRQEAVARVHPQRLRQPLGIALTLGLYTAVDGLRLGLQYCVKETKTWVTLLGWKETLAEQRERDVALCGFLRELADGIMPSLKGEAGSFSRSVFAELPDVIEVLLYRLDAETAWALASRLLEACHWLEAEPNDGVIDHAFGSVNLPITLDRILLDLLKGALCAQDVETLESTVQDATNFNCHPLMRSRIWRRLSQWSWEEALALGKLSVTGSLTWLLAREVTTPGVTGDSGIPFDAWADTANRILSGADRLGLDVPHELAEQVRRKVPTGDNAIVASLGLLATLKVSTAREDALQLLKSRAFALHELTDDPLEQERPKLHWTFIGCVQRELLSQNPDWASFELVDAIKLEVRRIMARDPNSPAVRIPIVDVPFVFAAYALAYGVAAPGIQQWFISELERQSEPPIRALGLCANRRYWGEYWDALVEVLTARATGDRVLETLLFVRNMANKGRFIDELVSGDLVSLIPLAVQQLDCTNELFANHAAGAIVTVAEYASESQLSTVSGMLVQKALRRCAEHPNALVRVGVAFGLGKLAHVANSEELRQLAKDLVGTLGDSERRGLVNDHSGSVVAGVQCGLKMGEVAARGAPGSDGA